MAAAAAMVGGGAVSAYGQMYQGQAAAAAGEYNAQLAERNAEDSLVQAKEEERRHRMISRNQLGDMRANIGASGVQVEGSVLEMLEDSAANAELDSLNIRHQGQSRAVQFRNEARLARFGGQTAQQGAYFGAASSLLTAGAQASGYGARGGGKK